MIEFAVGLAINTALIIHDVDFTRRAITSGGWYENNPIAREFTSRGAWVGLTVFAVSANMAAGLVAYCIDPGFGLVYNTVVGVAQVITPYLWASYFPGPVPPVAFPVVVIRF